MNNISDLTQDNFEDSLIRKVSLALNDTLETSLPNALVDDIKSSHCVANILNQEDQACFTPDKVISIKNSDNVSYIKQPIDSILGTLTVADNAFLNSILSNAIYSNNIWTINNIDKPVSFIKDKIVEAVHNENTLYNLKMWHFMKSFFSLIPDKNIDLSSEGSFTTKYENQINYTFKNGQYSANSGLAHASILKSLHPSGEGYVLHVTFRGTEFKRLPEYILNAYIDIETYFENFTPFNNAVKRYLNDPENNIKEVQVAGHSLGGALVQKFLEANPATQTVPLMYGYTFGSPGAKKHLLLKFLNLGYYLMKNHQLIWERPDKNDERLHEFYHSNDPIPKIGFLGYQRTGITHNLFDEVYEQSEDSLKSKKGFLENFPAFGSLITFFKHHVLEKFEVRFHSSQRYIANLKNLIDGHYITYPTLIKDMNVETTYWQEYNHSETLFKELAIKYESEVKNILINDNPNINSEHLSKKIIKIQESILQDGTNLAQPNIIKTNIIKNFEKLHSKVLAVTMNQKTLK
jgi:hypothetical protein